MPISAVRFFTTTTVTTVSAIAASNWLAMPNSGNSVLMPPSGSVTPISRMAPHAATTTTLQIHAPDPPAGILELAQRATEVAERVGQHEPRDPGAGVDGGEDEQRLEHDREVIPERPCRRVAAEDLLSTSDMPKASVGAPPVRETIDSSPTLPRRTLRYLRR